MHELRTGTRSGEESVSDKQMAGLPRLSWFIPMLSILDGMPHRRGSRHGGRTGGFTLARHCWALRGTILVICPTFKLYRTLAGFCTCLTMKGHRTAPRRAQHTTRRSPTCLHCPFP